MREDAAVIVDLPALIKYNSLTDIQERQIRERLSQLAKVPLDSWPPAELTYVPHDASYLLRGPDDLRVFFRREGDTITIVDIVPQELLNRYWPSKA